VLYVQEELGSSWTIFFSILRLLVPYEGFLFFIFYLFLFFQLLWTVLGYA
jgi:hypothetical protein